MNFEPQKFFIGLIDFFSILLPGALITYLLKETQWPNLPELTAYFHKEGPEGIVVFLFSSYLLGHFLFLVGSLLDDLIYDPIRKRTEEKQIENLLYGKKLSPVIIRWMASLFFKKRPDKAVNRIVKTKEAYLKRINAAEAVNAFQWCKLRLTKENPEALAIVNRFEANSKFFRSFLPILFSFTIASFVLSISSDKKYWFLAAGGSLIFLLFALWRYMEQRFKSTQQAYWAVLTLEAAQAQPQGNREKSMPSEKEEEKATHAGGVVYRQIKKKPVEYLLVQAKHNPNHWVLPKGHIESDEKQPYCAIREVREETGVWALIVKQKEEKDKPPVEKEVDLGITEYPVDDKTIRVRFYLMEYLKRGKSKEKRELKWLPYKDTLIQATHDETKEVLDLAEKKRAEL